MTFLFGIILFLIFSYFVIGVFDIRQNIFVKSINSVGKGNICLTFDDGPDPIMTPKILEILSRHGVKGTFFLIGENVLSNQELVKQISDEGHSIGNHTYYHNATFSMSCKNKITEEIKKTNQLLEQITSKKIIFFRPPFGITNPNINIVLKKLHLKSIGWGIRSLDTVTNDSIKLYNKVKKGIDKGESIILFHDRCESTLSILENIIIYCHEKGLKFKTINNA